MDGRLILLLSVASNSWDHIRPNYCIWLHLIQWRTPGAKFGERKKFSRTKISEWRYFWEKISIFTAKISDDLFFSHRPDFSDFPYLYCV